MSLSSENDRTSSTLISTNRRSVWALVIMLFAVLVVPMAFGRSQEPEPFGYSVVEKFQASSPEVVFLGNSLLDNRIDPNYLNDLTGINTSSLAIEGTAPGVWYLQHANIV
jgi:hypothetical protein